MIKSSKFIILSAIMCIIVCVGEFVTIFVFGSFYPGYNQLKDTMSLLGSSISPVSVEISVWWTFAGVFLIFFGTGFRKAFLAKGKYAKFASWLIIIYGFGEGIGSGLFKADRIANELTTSAFIHDAFGGFGVAAILLFPLIIQKVFTKNERPVFFRISQIVFVTGIITILFFLCRYLTNENNFFSVYKGLWQRLFMLNIYLYLTSIAILMIKKQQKNINKRKEI